MSGDSIPGQQHPLPPPPNHNDSDEEEVLEGIAYQAPPRTASLEPQTPVKNTPRKTYSSAKKSVPAVALTPQRRGRSSAPSSAAKSTTKTAVKAASKAAPSPTPNRKRAAPAEEIDSEARLTRSGAKSAATPTKSKGKKAPSKTPMSTVQRGRNSLAGTPTLASGLRDGLPTPSPALRASTRKRARGEGVSKTLTFGEDVFDDDEDEETKAKKHKTEEYTRERFLQNEKQRKLREARNYQFTGDSNAPRTTRSGRAIRDTRDEVMDVEEEELDEYGGKPQDEEPLAPDAPLIPEFELSTAPLVPTSPPLALSPAPEPENTTGQPLPDDAEPVLKTILNTLNSRGITRDPPSFLDEDKNEALQGIYNLIKGTVDRGEGNSALVVGPRGSGKTRTVARALSLLPSSAARTAPIIVRLSGLAQTTDRLAIREMGRQIAEAEGRVMEEEAVDEDERGEDEEYAPTTLPSHLLALLTAPSPRAIIILIEEFDLFTEHARQALLYCLFDVVQSVRSGPVGTTPRGLAVIGITPRLDTLLLLEKRVKSRFSHRIWRVTSPLASVMQGGVGGVGNGTEGQGRGGWEVLLKMALIPWYPESVMDDPEENEKWRGDWEYVIVTTLGDERIRRYFDRLVGLTTDVRVLYRPFILPITRVITRLDQKLDPKILADQILAQVETASFGLQNNKLRGLPTPCLGILIIAKHLAFAGREEFTYAMVEEEYLRFARTRLVGIGKVRWSVGVLRTAFSHLVRIALLAPTSSSTTVTNKQHPDFLKCWSRVGHLGKNLGWACLIKQSVSISSLHKPHQRYVFKQPWTALKNPRLHTYCEMGSTFWTLKTSPKPSKQVPTVFVCTKLANDVVDHQVVNIEYEGGVTASMTMVAFTESACDRGTRIQGTKGELMGDIVTTNRKTKLTIETYLIFDPHQNPPHHPCPPWPSRRRRLRACQGFRPGQGRRQRSKYSGGDSQGYLGFASARLFCGESEEGGQSHWF